MNLNRENAITIVALIITIIIMLILLGVAIHFGSDAVNRAKLEDIKTDMSSIKTKAIIIAGQYNFKEIDSLVGTPITPEEAQKVGIEGENIDKACKWSSNDLTNQGLSTIEGDVYIVQYNLDDAKNCEV